MGDLGGVWVVAATVLLGFAAGVLSGMFGIGGAVVTTPGVRALGLSPALAIGTTVPAILPGAVTGALRYRRDGLVDLRVGMVCGLVGAVAAIGGAFVSEIVDAGWLMVLTAGVLAWSGANSIRRAHLGRHEAAAGDRVEHRAGDHRSELVDDDAEGAVDPEHVAAVAGLAEPVDEAGELPPVVLSMPVLVAMGAGAGAFAGMLGVGGGVVLLPLFTSVLRLPVRRAVGTSLVAVAIFSIPAMITHALLGHIDWPVALGLVVGTVPGARVGARFAIGRSEQTMRVLIGVFFLVVAVIYGWRELAELLAR